MKLYGKIIVLSALIFSAPQLQPLAEHDATGYAIVGGVGATLATALTLKALMQRNHNGLETIIIPALVGLACGGITYAIVQEVLKQYTPKEKIDHAKKIISWVSSDRLMSDNFITEETFFAFLKQCNQSFKQAKNNFRSLKDRLHEATILLDSASQETKNSTHISDIKKITNKIEVLSKIIKTHVAMLEPAAKEIIFDASSKINLISEHPLAHDNFKDTTDFIESITSRVSLANIRWPLITTYDECTNMLTTLAKTYDDLKRISTDTALRSNESLFNQVKDMLATITSLSKRINKHSSILQKDARFNWQLGLYENAKKEATIEKQKNELAQLTQKQQAIAELMAQQQRELIQLEQKRQTEDRLRAEQQRYYEMGFQRAQR